MNIKNIEKASKTLEEIKQLDKEILQLEKFLLLENDGIVSISMLNPKEKKQEETDQVPYNPMMSILWGGIEKSTKTDNTEKSTFVFDKFEMQFILTGLIRLKSAQRECLLTNLNQ